MTQEEYNMYAFHAPFDDEIDSDNDDDDQSQGSDDGGLKLSGLYYTEMNG
eukprot:CAMPEP_0198119750 /NCGR_PEP_ID=MMETSP1442-20131203/26877_1 /TAXON_ID= /ORGANISM="Craspedostauros australis, Strain CCMP3328" /LENGTH=49 /DNA_ID= /DNA_START= /DNA_END= /DNA_ORIENTATION=